MKAAGAALKLRYLHEGRFQRLTGIGGRVLQEVLHA
jgi:hypothetical protein